MTSSTGGTPGTSLESHFTKLLAGPGSSILAGSSLSALHKVDGTIRCSVRRPDSDQNWWMVADCADQEIGSYYRGLYWLEHNKGSKLMRPYWPLHVTVVRNEEPPNVGRWWDYDGEQLDFYHLPCVRTNWTAERYRSFYWLDVICPRFEEIRVELGLAKNPDGIYHMSIGTVENEENREAYERMWAATGVEATKGGHDD